MNMLYSVGVFSCELAGLASIISENTTFAQTVSLIGKHCDISLASIKRDYGVCLKLEILLSLDTCSPQHVVLVSFMVKSHIMLSDKTP